MLIEILFLPIFALGSSLTVSDEYHKGGEVSVTVISIQEANELFAELFSHREIPFNYPVDGCYARATAMTKVAEARNLEMGKAWVEGFLRIKTQSPEYPEIIWPYHVAPFLFVKKENGTIEKIIFDPSLFDRPVTLEKWTSVMKTTGDPKAKIEKLYFSARFQLDRPHKESKKYSWLQADLEKVKLVNEHYLKRAKEMERQGLGFGKNNRPRKKVYKKNKSIAKKGQR